MKYFLSGSTRVSCLFLLLLLAGCKPEYRIRTVVEFDDKTDALQAEKQAALDEVHERIVAEYGQTVTLTHDGREIFWETPHTDQPVGEMAQLIAYFGSAEFGVYDLYYAGDAPLPALLDSIPPEQYGLARNTGTFGPAVLAVTTDLRQLPAYLDALNNHPGKPLDLRFAARSPGRFGVSSQQPALVFALKGHPADGAPLLTNDVLTAADVAPDGNGSIAVLLTMNDAGSAEWERITTAAFNDGNRQLALVVNGEVWSAPAVQSPIFGGKTMITGGADFNVEQAEHLAKQLLWDPLPLPLRIVRQDVVE